MECDNPSSYLSDISAHWAGKVPPPQCIVAWKGQQATQVADSFFGDSPVVRYRIM